MTDAADDLFDKMAALREKRAPEVLKDSTTSLSEEDFPVLIEVIDPNVPASERRATDRRQNDRRTRPRRAEPADPPAAAALPVHTQVIPAHPNAEMEQLILAMEARLTDLFIRQQARIEETVRKTVREVLAEGHTSPPL